MKLTTRLLSVAGLAAVLAIAAPASAQTVRYADTGTTGLNSTAGVVSYLEAFTPIGTGANTLSSLTFGIGVAAGAAASTQAAVFDFYRNVDTSPTAANALAQSTRLGSFSVSYTSTANTGTGTAYRAFTVSGLNALTSPITFQLDGSTGFGVVTSLTNATLTNYSTTSAGLFTLSAPNVGTAYSYVWNDANLNGVFTGSEQTRFGQAGPTYSYLSISTIPVAVAAVPEPATWAMMILGMGTVGFAMRRRAKVATAVFHAA